MLRTFRFVPANAALRDLAVELLDGSQRDFPVVSDGMFVGMLRRETLLDHLNREDDVRVQEVMELDIRSTEEREPLISALERATPASGAILPVTNGGALTGLLDSQRALDLARARVRRRNTPTYTPTRAPQQPVANTT
jgi:predicted transcriptional regulator